MRSCRYHIVIYAFLALTVFTGCRPRGILHSWEMRKVLVDLHKTDALLQVAGLQYGHEEAKNYYYAQVLAKHGISQAQFDSSIVWYTAHPQLFDKIYPRVNKQLEKEETEFLALHAEELSKVPVIQEAEPALSLTPLQLDSLIWTATKGCPNSWNPLMHDLKYQFFPEIRVLR